MTTTTALSPSAGGVLGLRQRLLLNRQEMRKLKARRNHGLSEDLEYLRRRTTETETLDALALIVADHDAHRAFSRDIINLQAAISLIEAVLGQ